MMRIHLSKVLSNVGSIEKLIEFMSFDIRPRLGIKLIQIPILLALLAWSQTGFAAPAFTKAFNPNTIGPGSTSRLVFTITNDATAVTNLAFTDNLPASVVIATPANISQNCSGSVSASAGGSSISISDGRLAAFQSCSVAVNVTSATPGTHTNVSGDLTSSDGNSGNATADLTVVTDRPGFSKSFSPASISLGDRTTLTFVIDNSANANLRSSLNFTDNLPTGLEIADPSNVSSSCTNTNVTANAGSSQLSVSPVAFGLPAVAAGGICTISVDIVATGIGALVNQTSELTSSNQFGQQSNSGFAAAGIDVDVSTVHLIKEFVDDPVAPGGTVELQFTILNRDRRNDATNLSFSDDLSSVLAGLSALDLPANNICGSGSSLSGTSTITLNGGSLAGGESCTFSVLLSVPAGATAGGYTNMTSALTGDILGDNFVSNMASDTLFIDVAPALTKTFLTNPVGGGDTVTMEFTVTNASASSTATNISFLDNISEFISGSIASGLPKSDVCGVGSSLTAVSLGTEINGIQLSGGTLGGGESCTFTADVVIPVGTQGGLQTNVTEPVSATIDGSTRSGNAAQASLTVVETPELDKEFIDDPVSPGNSTTLRFVITNPESAPTSASDIAFSDDLDATLSGLIATNLPLNDVCGTGSSVTGTSVINVSGASLGIDESCQFDVTVSVPASALPGSYENNTSDVTANLDGIVASGLGGSDTLIVAGLDLSKSFAQSSIIAGGTATLQFSVSNSSTTLDATEILFSDNIDQFIDGATVTSTLPQSDVCGVGSSLVQSGASIFLTDGSLAAGQSCNFSVDVLVPASTEDGTYQNRTANFRANINGNLIPLNQATADLEVNSILIDLSKSFSDGAVSVGSTATLNFNLSNLSSSETVTDIAFSDDLGAVLSGLMATGLPQSNICGSGSSLSGSSVISLTGGSLAPGASCSFSVSLAMPGSANGVSSITNVTSDASGLVGNLSVSGEAATASANVVNVSFTKSFDTAAVAGDSTTVNFKIENEGSTVLDRLFFTDNLEAMIAGATASGLPESDVCGTGSLLTGASIITLSAGSLAPGGACQFSVAINVPVETEGGDYLNTTSVLSNEEFTVAPAASATLEVLTRSASFEKSFNSPVVAGDSTSLTFTIDNTGTAALTDISFSDDLDAVISGMVATDTPQSNVCGSGSSLSGTDNVSLTGGSLAAGDSCVFTIDVSVPSGTAGGTYTNTTSALSEGEIALTDPATADLEVLTRSANFSKSFAGSVEAGTSTTLSFTINNTGTAALNDVSFTDDLDAVVSGMVATGLPQSGVCGAGSAVSGTSLITLSGANLVAGDSCTFSVNVDVPVTTNAGTYVNVTSDLAEAGSAIAGPATASLSVTEANGDVTICHKPGTPAEKTKVIPIAALNGHLGHGDTIGACEEDTNSAPAAPTKNGPNKNSSSASIESSTDQPSYRVVEEDSSSTMSSWVGGLFGGWSIFSDSDESDLNDVCHETEEGKQVTMSVSDDDLERHLDHGDDEDACED